MGYKGGTTAGKHRSLSTQRMQHVFVHRVPFCSPHVHTCPRMLTYADTFTHFRTWPRMSTKTCPQVSTYVHICARMCALVRTYVHMCQHARTCQTYRKTHVEHMPSHGHTCPHMACPCKPTHVRACPHMSTEGYANMCAPTLRGHPRRTSVPRSTALGCKPCMTACACNAGVSSSLLAAVVHVRVQAMQGGATGGAKSASETSQGNATGGAQSVMARNRCPIMNSHVFTCAHMCSHAHTCAHMCSHVFTCVHRCSHAHTCARMCLPLFTCVHMCTHARTSPYVYTQRNNESGNVNAILLHPLYWHPTVLAKGLPRKDNLFALFRATGGLMRFNGGE